MWSIPEYQNPGTWGLAQMDHLSNVFRVWECVINIYIKNVRQVIHFRVPESWNLGIGENGLPV